MLSTWARTAGAVAVGAVVGFGVGYEWQPQIQEPPFGDAGVEEMGESELGVTAGEKPLLVFGEGDSGERQLFDLVPKGGKRVVPRKNQISIYALDRLKHCPWPGEPCIDCKVAQCGALRPPMSMAMFEPQRSPGNRWCSCEDYLNGKCKPSDEECSVEAGD